MRYFIIALALMLLPVSAEAGTNGISQLTTVSQQKSDNANDAATQGATQQRGLIQQQNGGSKPQSVKSLKPPKAKLPNPNIAKVKQLDAQMKALKPKLESITGLPADQQKRIDQMHDMLMKMMALMNALMNQIEEQQSAQ